MNGLQNFQVETLLTPRRQVHPRIYAEHPLKEFFADRVSQRSLARALHVSRQSLYLWFSGRVQIPPARLGELNLLKRKILDWEAKKGRIFGT
jgi:hypothetical protein